MIEQSSKQALKGTENGRAKLSDLDVLLMRALHKQGFRQVILCAMFDASPYTVSTIVRNKSWRHLGDMA
jgi:hypothetical protein